MRSWKNHILLLLNTGFVLFHLILLFMCQVLIIIQKYFKNLSEALEVFEMLKNDIKDMRKITLTVHLKDRIVLLDEFSGISNLKSNVDFRDRHYG